MSKVWMPVDERFILTYDTGLINMPKRFIRWNAEDESVLVGTDDGNFYHCPLPDDLRLCRLTEAAAVDMPDDLLNAISICANYGMPLGITHADYNAARDMVRRWLDKEANNE